MDDPWRALVERARARPGEPFITCIRNGDRTELSAATFLNGASKIANALQEAGVDEDSSVSVHLPWHWQRSLWCAGALATGARVEPFASDGDVVVCAVDDAEALAASARTDVFVVSMHPLGLPSKEPLPAGCVDAASAVMAQPDTFAAIGARRRQWSGATNGVREGERVLVDCTDRRDPQSWSWSFEVPAIRELSLVMSSAGDQEVVDAIARQERVDTIIRLP